MLLAQREMELKLEARSKNQSLRFRAAVPKHGVDVASILEIATVVLGICSAFG